MRVRKESFSFAPCTVYKNHIAYYMPIFCESMHSNVLTTAMDVSVFIRGSFKSGKEKKL